MAINNRKLGHSHKITVPTKNKGISIAQAGRQVAKAKSIQPSSLPTSSYVPYDGTAMGGDTTPQMKYGGIHINPANKGKFNATKKKTGKSTEELTHSSNPLTRKRAIFAQNARKWHHADGGWIEQYQDGGSVAAARKKPGGSNVGKKTFANGSKRHGPYAGTAGGAPKGSYPIPDINHARAALALAHHAPNPEGIRRKVLSAYPQLKKALGGYIDKYSIGGWLKDNGQYIAQAGVGIGEGVAQLGAAGLLPKFNSKPTTKPTQSNSQGVNQNIPQSQGNIQQPTLSAPVNTMNLMGGSATAGQMTPENMAFANRHFYPDRLNSVQEHPYGLSGQTDTSQLAPMANGGYTRAGGWSVGAGDNMRKLGYSAGQMIGGNQNYPGPQQFPPEYGFGGVLKAISPFAPMLSLIPGIGPFAAMGVQAAGAIGGAADQKVTDQDLQRQQAIATANAAQSKLAWGGRIPETRAGGYGPSGLTLGHVPGLSHTPKGPAPAKGFNYTSQHGPSVNEGAPWQRQTMMNVRRHPGPFQYAFGGQTSDNDMDEIAQKYAADQGNAPGQTPVELEGAPQGQEQGEVFQTPQGQMGQVEGPSHDQGGVDMNLPPKTFVWSARLKSRNPQFKGQTFASAAAKLGKEKARYEKILKSA